MADVMMCPHCHGSIPSGATVCRGCQAEVEYGAPWWANIGAVVLGVLAWAAVFDFSSKLGAALGVVVAIALLFFMNWAFRKRVVFKRIYRTGP